MQIVAALIEALRLRGVQRVYGVPGDYVLGLFAALQASPIEENGNSQFRQFALGAICSWASDNRSQRHRASCRSPSLGHLCSVRAPAPR
jgi:hypothetical protein